MVAVVVSNNNYYDVLYTSRDDNTVTLLTTLLLFCNLNASLSDQLTVDCWYWYWTNEWTILTKWWQVHICLLLFFFYFNLLAKTQYCKGQKPQKLVYRKKYSVTYSLDFWRNSTKPKRCCWMSIKEKHVRQDRKKSNILNILHKHFFLLCSLTFILYFFSFFSFIN